MEAEEESKLRPQEQYEDGHLEVQVEGGKVGQIIAACKEPGDLEPLIALASSTNGLVNDRLRRLACMLVILKTVQVGSYRA